jgi:two-component system, NarL family, sensor kinase
MVNTDNGIDVLILVSVILAVLFVALILMALYLLRQRSRAREFEQLSMIHTREMELARQEIYRRSLEHVSTEIHDNIGQQLSLVKLRLGIAVMEPGVATKEWLVQLHNMTSQLMEDMRYLVKNMHHDSLESVELPEAIQSEMARINRGGELSGRMITNGIPARLDQKVTIVLLRMVQESIYNIEKYSKVKNCLVTLNYTSDQLILEITDEDIGLESEELLSDPPAERKTGIDKIARRSVLIGATMTTKIASGNGTSISICLPITQNTQEDEQ